jgi:hypothetical protein
MSNIAASAVTVLVMGAGRGIGRSSDCNQARETSTHSFVWDVAEGGPRRKAFFAAVCDAKGPPGHWKLQRVK